MTNMPVVTIKGDNVELELEGTIRNLKVVERKMKKEIVSVAQEFAELSISDVCMILSVFSGKEQSLIEDEYIMDIGIDEAKFCIMEIIMISLVPPSKREEKRESAKKLRELLEQGQELAKQAMK